MSSGSPMRPTGIDCNEALVRGSLGGFAAKYSSVAIGPGQTQFTVIPAEANSKDQVRVRPIRAALLAE